MSFRRIIAAALRQRAASVLFTLLLVCLQASLFGLPVWQAVLGWVCLWLLALLGWYLGENWLLALAGCRAATPPERDRLAAVHPASALRLRVDEDDATWVEAGLRTLLVSRGALEVLDDPELTGMLADAEARAQAAGAAGQLLAWIGTAPLSMLQSAGRLVGQFGRVVAMELGTLVVIPVVVWPDGFVRVAGAVFGAVFVLIASCILAAGGSIGLGAGLLLAWVALPGLRVIQEWEARRIEARADRAAAQAGFGRHLIAALELLVLLQPAPAPSSLVARLLGTRPPTEARIQRLWRLMEQVHH